MEAGKRLFRRPVAGGAWTRVPARLPTVGVIAGISFDQAGTGFAWFDRGGLDATRDGGRRWDSLPIINPGESDAGCDDTILAQPIAGTSAMLLDQRCTSAGHTVDLRLSGNFGRTWRLVRSWVVPTTYGTGRWP